jgi:hypothetical protein
MSSEYTKEECFDAISFVAESVDEPITVNDYRNNKREIHPSIQALKDAFDGSISRAFYRAGYTPTRYTNPTYKECEEAFQRVVNKNGSIPRRTDYMKLRRKPTTLVVG